VAEAENSPSPPGFPIRHFVSQHVTARPRQLGGRNRRIVRLKVLDMHFPGGRPVLIRQFVHQRRDHFFFLTWRNSHGYSSLQGERGVMPDSYRLKPHVGPLGGNGAGHGVALAFTATRLSAGPAVPPDHPPAPKKARRAETERAGIFPRAGMGARRLSPPRLWRRCGTTAQRRSVADHACNGS